VTARCSKVGCGEPAEAAVGFDSAAALLWLDPFDGATRGAALLCKTHADTLTPWRGWHLQDRRVRQPRLWVDRPAPVCAAPAGRAGPRPRRRHRRAPAADPLPFTDPGDRFAEQSSPAHRGDVRGAGVTADARPWAGDAERVLDARTPLLARAFQSARVG
jgi:hypothetical protein